MSKSSSLLNAIGNYLDGTASAEEEQLVNDWYHSFDHADAEIPVELLELRNKVGSRLWRRLTATIEDGGRKERRFFLGYGKGLVAAACIGVLLLAGEGLYLFRRQPEKIQVAAQLLPNDVAPGGDKAVLTLADGSKIVLDSAHKGMLTRQGSTAIVKLAGGQLAYKTASSQKDTQEPLAYNTITTPRGGQFRVTLPDGTSVWLNAATSLRYPTRFAGAERRVSLTGEAYFEVAGNAGQPFIIDMPDHRITQDTLHIQVLGTNFNVNGYEDEATVKTTLIEGAVKIIQGRNAHQLSPGQQAQTANTGTGKIIPDADTEEALAWKNGLFQYNSTGLKAIMRQMARWYDVQIIYEGDMKDETFSGSMPRMEKVSQLLHMLAMTNTVHFRIEGRDIYVKP